MNTGMPDHFIEVDSETFHRLMEEENYTHDGIGDKIFYVNRFEEQIGCKEDSGRCFVDPGYFSLSP